MAYSYQGREIVAATGEVYERQPRQPAGTALSLRRRSPITFGGKRNRFGIRIDTLPDYDGASSSSGKSAQSAVSAAGSAPAPVPSMGSGNWMNSRSRSGIGLGEAFARTDENGGYRPKTAPESIGSDFENHPYTTRDSHLPISNAYATGATEYSSPPKIINNMPARAEVGERRRTPAPEDNESESSDARQGSPSPFPRKGRGWHYRGDRPPQKEAPKRVAREYTDEEYAQRNAALERRRARDRAAAFSNVPQVPKKIELPAYLRNNVGPKVAETTRTLARKASTGSFEKSPANAKLNISEDSGIAQSSERKMSTSSFGDDALQRVEKNSVDNHYEPAPIKTMANDFDNEPLPPVRYPASWGTRASRRPGWMQKILSPDNSLEIKSTGEAPIESQQAAADTPLPTIEIESSQQEPTPPSSRPVSAQPNNESPEKSRMWAADADFTAQSLQLSTSPMLRVRSTKLDEIREREIQSLTARAVATNRLEEIRERNSEERSLREPSPAPKPEEPEEPEYHERTILEEEGYPIPNTPITVFPYNSYRPKLGTSEANNDRPSHKREDSYDVLKKLSRVLSQSPVPEQDPTDEKEQDHKTSPEKANSKELETAIETPIEPVKRTVPKAAGKAVEQLTGQEAEMPNNDPELNVEEKPLQSRLEKRRAERLAAKEEAATTEKKTIDPPMEKPADRTLDRPHERRRNITGLEVDEGKRRSTASTPKSDVDPEERITAEAKLFELQDNKSERNSLHIPSRSPSPSNDGNFDETPKPKADPLSLPTPRVTGAFIETPAPIARMARKQRSISPSYEIVDPVENISSSDGSSKESKIEPSNSLSTAQPTGPLEPSRITSRRHSESRSASSGRASIESQRITQRRPLINTARPKTAAEDLRRIQQEAGVEDSTLDDFQTQVSHDSALVATGRDTRDPLLDLDYDDEDLLLSVTERERRIERILLARMEQRLRNTSSSIRDARHGIERILDHEVASGPRKAKDDPHALTFSVQLNLPRLWINYPEATPRGRFGRLWSRNWKFTWLGFIIALFVGWYIAESAMCEAFCHPINSSTNDWSPSDPFFPWAIPTKLDQWTGEIVSTAAVTVGEALHEWYDPGYKKRPIWNPWWGYRGGPIGIQRPPVTNTFNDDEIWNDD